MLPCERVCAFLILFNIFTVDGLNLIATSLVFNSFLAIKYILLFENNLLTLSSESITFILSDKNNFMMLVERHKIGRSHDYFKEIDALCFLSKNLYNAANYATRQVFINTAKEKEAGLREHAEWLRYNELQKQFQNDKQPDYTALPAKVSQQILMILERNWKSFFASMKDWKKNPQKYKGRPCLPKYLDKVDGRNLLTYTIQAVSKKGLKDGVLHLSGTTIKVRTKQQNIQQVRIIPKCGFYTIEVVYKKEREDKKLDKNRVAGCDIGVNNLAAVTSNVDGLQPILINGRPLKNINHYYNKNRARLQSYVGVGSSKKLRKLTEKRNQKIEYELHCASKFVISHLVKNNIGTLVIGKNDRWKTSVNLGARNNQNFVQIPHARLINMLTYKAEMVGITVLLTEESHTSKCSFIDNESIEHHEKYAGKRVKRGLFVSANSTLINADCQGSGNIIKKAVPNAFANGIQGVVVRPARIYLS